MTTERAFQKRVCGQVWLEAEMGPSRQKSRASPRAGASTRRECMHPPAALQPFSTSSPWARLLDRTTAHADLAQVIRAILLGIAAIITALGAPAAIRAVASADIHIVLETKPAVPATRPARPPAKAPTAQSRGSSEGLPDPANAMVWAMTGKSTLLGTYLPRARYGDPRHLVTVTSDCHRPARRSLPSPRI